MDKLDNSFKRFDPSLKNWSADEIQAGERDAVAWVNGMTLLDSVRDEAFRYPPEFKVTQRDESTGLPLKVQADFNSDGTIEASLDLMYRDRSLYQVNADFGNDGDIDITARRGSPNEKMLSYVEFVDADGDVEAVGTFAAHDTDHKRKSFDVKDATNDEMLGSLSFSRDFPEIVRYRIDAHGDGRGLRDGVVRRNADGDVGYF